MSEYGANVATRTVHMERVLPGPIERVWAYLTDSEKRATWFAGGEMEPRVGGKITLLWRNSALSPDDSERLAQDAPPEPVFGRVTKYDPPRQLAYVWPMGGVEGEVTFDLKPAGEDVLLTITHERLKDRGQMVMVSSGWATHVRVLVDQLEGRTPASFWQEIHRLEGEFEKRVPAA